MRTCSRWIAILLLGLRLVPAWGQLRLQVTVTDRKTGEAATGLTAADFTVWEDRNRRAVQAAEYRTGPVDPMLLLDTSLVGEVVRPLAAELIAQLAEKEQMAVVSFHSAADLIQDFTSSKQLLLRSLENLRYGNAPNVLDALYAAVDGGFQPATFRRVVLLLTTGFEGSSRVTEQQVIRVARRQGVSIYPIFVVGSERSMFERLARGTGGAMFQLAEMRKQKPGGIAERIFATVRGSYTLTLQGNLRLSDKARIEVTRPEKALVAILPLE